MSRYLYFDNKEDVNIMREPYNYAVFVHYISVLENLITGYLILPPRYKQIKSVGWV